jgi:hypothetical protein
MRHHHPDNSRQTVIQFPPPSLSVIYELGVFGNSLLIERIRADLAHIVGGNGDIVPVSVLPSARVEIERALEKRGLAVRFNEDSREIVITSAPEDPGDEDESDGSNSGAWDAGRFKRGGN